MPNPHKDPTLQIAPPHSAFGYRKRHAPALCVCFDLTQRSSLTTEFPRLVLSESRTRPLDPGRVVALIVWIPR